MEKVFNANKIKNLGRMTGSELKLLCLCTKYSDNENRVIIDESFRKYLHSDNVRLAVSTMKGMCNNFVKKGYMLKSSISEFRISPEYIIKLEDNGLIGNQTGVL